MDDLVRRNDVIDALHSLAHRFEDPEDWCILEGEAEFVVSKLPSAQRWIPCSERLPEEHGFYLVSVGAPYKHIRVYQYEPCTGYENENLWRGEDGSYCFNWFVEAWRPLPESYKGDKE